MHEDFCHFQHIDFLLMYSINIFNQQPIERLIHGQQSKYCWLPTWKQLAVFIKMFLVSSSVKKDARVQCSRLWFLPALSSSLTISHVTLNLHQLCSLHSPCWQKKKKKLDSSQNCTKPPMLMEKGNLKCMHTTNGIREAPFLHRKNRSANT